MTRENELRATLTRCKRGNRIVASYVRVDDVDSTIFDELRKTANRRKVERVAQRQPMPFESTRGRSHVLRELARRMYRKLDLDTTLCERTGEIGYMRFATAYSFG